MARRTRFAPRTWVRGLLEPWLPMTCVGCSQVGPSPCEECLVTLHDAPTEGLPAGIDHLAALLAYDDRSRSFVTSFKQFGDPLLIEPLLDAMVDLLPSDPFVLTWAPTTARRRRSRGHDHARVLSAEVARRAGRRPVRLLRRSRGPSQEGRSRRERLEGIGFSAIEALVATVPHDVTVVVVDDVVTTGATMSAAARALRTAGVTSVEGLALARTPGRTGQGA